MKNLKFTDFNSTSQYKSYCEILEKLLEKADKGKDTQDEIELLTLLIEKWDAKHSTLNELNPIELLQSLMLEHKMRAKDLAVILGVSQGLVSAILNYNKGLSKDIIRRLSVHFKVSEEAFDRPY